MNLVAQMLNSIPTTFVIFFVFFAITFVTVFGIIFISIIKTAKATKKTEKDPPQTGISLLKDDTKVNNAQDNFVCCEYCGSKVDKKESKCPYCCASIKVKRK